MHVPWRFGVMTQHRAYGRTEPVQLPTWSTFLAFSCLFDAESSIQAEYFNNPDSVSGLMPPVQSAVTSYAYSAAHSHVYSW